MNSVTTFRVGDAPVPGTRYVLRHGAYALLPRGRSMLLTYWDGEEPEFQLPGGGIDPGESPIRALHREVMEETGWTISGPKRLGAFRRFTYMPEYDLWAQKLCTIYVARPVLQLSDPTEPNHTAVWTPIETAAALLGNDGDKRFAAAWAARIR